MKNISQDRENPVPPTYKTDCCLITLVNHNVATLHRQLLTNFSCYRVRQEAGARCRVLHHVPV